jgi:adenosylhomocysteine nucleosidase
METVAVLTPMDEECAALVDALGARGHVPQARQVGRLRVLDFPGLALTLAVGGHGKSQFGVQTQHFLDHAGPVGLVVCAGAAGSLTERVGVGDVVASTETVEHDYTLRFVTRPLPRFPGHEPSLQALREVHEKGGHSFGLQFGPVASGDEDVICAHRARELAIETGALCVAWEGSGAARACRFSEVPFVELRCVTDWADKTAAADFDANLVLCMANLAALLHGWLAVSEREGS